MKQISDQLIFKVKRDDSVVQTSNGLPDGNINSSFDAISALVQDLRFNVEGNVEKRDVEAALQILFWPTNDNLWDRAEAVCMKRAKELFSQILKGDEDPFTPAPDLKNCLQVLVYLGEMRDRAPA